MKNKLLLLLILLTFPLSLYAAQETILSGPGVYWNADVVPDLNGNFSELYGPIQVQWFPIGWAEDGTNAPAAEAAVTGTLRKVGRAFAGVTTDEDVTFIWRLPYDFDSTTVTARVTGVVSHATAPADTEIVAFSIAVACYGNSDLSTLAVGTAQTSSLTADGNYAQYDNLDTAFSNAITPSGGAPAAGQECAIALKRLATTTDTYGQDFDVTGIEIKYTIKVTDS